MHVVHHTHLHEEDRPGERRLALAGNQQGIAAFQVWLSTLAPGAATEELVHDGELVAIAEEGSGKLLVQGAPQRFQSPCTLVIPPAHAFAIANHGGTPLRLLWVFTRPPRAAAGTGCD